MKRLTAVWIGGLLAVSLQPWRPDAGAALAVFHRPFHAAAFAATALVLWRASGRWPAALSASLLLGGATEVLQYWIYRNRMEWWDVRDDALAAAAAILAGLAFRFARKAGEPL